MNATPCKDCGFRSVLCHSTCESYTKWALEKRRERIQTNKEKASLDKMYDYGGKWRRGRYQKT